eukprot:scaffold18633_cov62-Isochrysis_galbana.AAC.1
MARGGGEVDPAGWWVGSVGEWGVKDKKASMWGHAGHRERANRRGREGGPAPPPPPLPHPSLGLLSPPCPCRWGTHGYMAPEVLRGECYSTAVDLFSVGASAPAPGNEINQKPPPHTSSSSPHCLLTQPCSS